MKDVVARGFTLIELIVVITILGVVAAVALPRFVGLNTDARVATVNSLAGSIKAAASLARSLAMVTGATATVVMDGASVSLLNKYPDATAAGIPLAVNSNNGATGDFTFKAGSGTGTAATWTRNGATTAAKCEVKYKAAVAGSTPTVTVVTTGC